MAKLKVIMVWERPAPKLDTPRLGEPGDVCDRTLEAECRIDNIIRRYGEIVPPCQQGDIDMSDVPDDPVDKMEYIKTLKATLASRGLGLDGSIIDRELFNKTFPKTTEVNDEKEETEKVAE